MANTSATIRDPNDPTKRMAVPLVNGRYVGSTPSGWSGWELETQAPIAQSQPSIQRTSDGQIQTLVDPLNQWKNQTSFMEAAKNIIKKKQSMNQDIQAAKTYWRTLIADTSPFGGARETQLTGAFQDKTLRELSPEDQASIRASRYSAANANLQGLSEEEQYRETTTKDTLQVLKDLWQEQEDLQKQKMDSAKYKLEMQKLQLEIKKAGQEIGYTVDDNGNVIKDVSSATAQQIADTIKEIESNGNYTAQGKSGEYGAYQYTPGTWEKYSREYLAAKGESLRKSLAMTPENQDAVTLFKINQWLSKGYSPQEIAAGWNWGEGNLGKDYSRVVGTNSAGVQYSVPAYVQRFTNVLSTKSASPQDIIEPTDAVKFSLMKTAGLKNSDIKGYTADDWILLEKATREATFDDAFAKVNGEGNEKGWKDGMTIRGVTVKSDDSNLGELIRSKLLEDYGDLLSSTEIDSIMLQSGFIKDDNLFSGKWKKAS